MKKVLIAIITTVTILLALAGGIVALVCTDYGQQRLKGYAIEMLGDRLKTNIELDSINVSFTHGGVELFGLRVDDRQGERMAQLDTLTVSFRLWELLNRKVIVTNASCTSPKLNIYKTRPDSAANYQFVIDTFKKDKEKKVEKDTTRKMFRLVVDVDDFSAKVHNIDLQYETRYDGGLLLHGSIGSAVFSVPKTSIDVSHLDVSHRLYIDKTKLFHATIGHINANYSTLKATLDDVYAYKTGVKCTIKTLAVAGDSTRRDLTISGVNLITDNGKPHKHRGMATRGWFDAGHLNITADASISLLSDVHKFKKGDTISIALNSIKAIDKGSGLRADSLSFNVKTDLKTATVSNFYLRDHKTAVIIPRASLTIPNKKEKKAFAFSAPHTHGYTVLKDIARPFTPALSRFTTPLMFSTNFSGDAEHLVFRDIIVKTKDGRLGINASGGINGLRGGSRALKIHFDVSHMHARKGIKEQIIKHFVYRKSLVGLLRSAGNIGYQGSVEIGYKYERFKGLVTTSLGKINATVYLDEKTKYMTCSANSDNFDAGTMFNVSGLKELAVKANASFDIAGNKGSKILHRKRGKLPAGWLNGVVKEIKYKFVTCRNVTFNLTCDGDVAKGTIDMNKLFMDTAFDFTFTDTQFGHSLKIKPHLHVHNVFKGIKTLIERNKEKRAARRTAKAAAKAEKEAAKAKEKALKDKEKAQKKAQKEADKAQKKAQKEADKAQKKAEKAAKKAANATTDDMSKS